MGLLDLTVVIPARNEAAGIGRFLTSLRAFAHAPSQILVVDDHSTDGTADTVTRLGVRVLPNIHDPGYGYAVRMGLARANTSWVAIMTADGSDSVTDLLTMYFVRRRAPLIFGDRWGKAGQVDGYPWVKAGLNRLGNNWIARKTRTAYADWTNPFKLYPTALVHQILPLLTEPGLSAGLELALQAWRHPDAPDFHVVPHHWVERTAGRSHFHLLSTSTQYVQTVRRILG